ncbi:MAG: type IV toxin-antitoxin system AbiEi family antitoxin domain-containing protein [Solirubrobacterales bacterium]
MWDLADRQHGVIGRGQLRGLGFGPKAIEHRLANGRLHPVARGVYAVGRPSLTQRGHWMRAVLSCGYNPGEGAPTVVLSHGSAARLLGIGEERSTAIEVSVRSPSDRRRPGVRVHRRQALRNEDVGFCEQIPVTSPAQTILDMAARLPRIEVERMVDEADRLDLIHPPELRAALEEHPPQPGLARLRTWLDRRTFRMTRSKLERWFLPLAARAGLPLSSPAGEPRPATKAWVNGFEVDFHWPELRLVVETDGLRHHRTPAQQARDRERDQAHVSAGYTSLRFTHEQVRYEPERVLATLRPVAARLLACVP